MSNSPEHFSHASTLEYLRAKQHFGGAGGRIGDDVEAHFFHLEARSDCEDCGSVVAWTSAVKACNAAGAETFLLFGAIQVEKAGESVHQAQRGPSRASKALTHEGYGNSRRGVI